MAFIFSSMASWLIKDVPENKSTSLATQSLAGSASQLNVPKVSISSATPRWQKLTPSALPQSAMSNLTLTFFTASTADKSASKASIVAPLSVP